MTVASAAYAAALSINAATSVVFDGATDEPCSFVSGSGSTKIYQITNAAKRVIDPTQATVSVKDGVTVLVEGTDYWLDYQHGIIFFIAHAVVGAITILKSCKYFPLIELGYVKEWNLDSGFAVLPATVTGAAATGATYKIAGIKSADVNANLLTNLADIIEGARTLRSSLLARTMVLLSFTFPNSVSFRAWVQLDKDTVKAAMAGQLEASLSGQSSGTRKGASHSWSDLYVQP